MKNKCLYEGCNNKPHTRGYCKKHYDKLLKSGKLEVIRKYHGYSDTPEYYSYNHMLGRCYNSNQWDYYRYGGRGITVCDKWKNSFVEFIKDMKDKPFKGAEIDRIDNDGNYEPCNCEWVSHKENGQHKSNVYLNQKAADEIRELINNNILSRKDASARYNVCKANIDAIMQGRIWN